MHLINIAKTTLLILVSGAAFAEVPHIKNLSINPTPPGAKVGAAYFNLHNPNNSAITLSKVSSPAINRVEMHLSTVVDDVAKMQKLDSVEIAPNETFSFTHGGHHIMLMDLEEPLFPGDLIPIVFHTDQGDITIEARVAEKIMLPKDGMQHLGHGEADAKNKNHGKAKHENMEHGQTEHDVVKHDG